MSSFPFFCNSPIPYNSHTKGPGVKAGALLFHIKLLATPSEDHGINLDYAAAP